MTTNTDLSILVVDDDAETLGTMTALLSFLGIRIIEATKSAEAALQILENHRFHIILSDYQMEGMDGVAFLERLRAEGDLTPILLISGAPDKAGVIQALRQPRVEFFGKPFEIASLQGAVERLLAA